MTPDIPDMSNLSAARFLAGMIVLHEVSSHAELIPRTTQQLAALLGAASVTMILVGITPTGDEVARTVHATSLCQLSEGPDNDWVKALLNERRTQPEVERSQARVIQFASDGRIQALFDLDAEHVLVLDIQAAAAFFSITDNGRSWLVAFLGHVASNLRTQIDRPHPAVRQAAPLSELTHGEWRVLLAMDCTASEKEIAASLSLSRHTLHAHIKSIYRLFRVQSRLEALSVLHRAEREAMLGELQNQYSGQPGEGGMPGLPVGDALNVDWAQSPKQPTITISPIASRPFQRLAPKCLAGRKGCALAKCR